MFKKHASGRHVMYLPPARSWSWACGRGRRPERRWHTTMPCNTQSCSAWSDRPTTERSWPHTCTSRRRGCPTCTSWYWCSSGSGSGRCSPAPGLARRKRSPPWCLFAERRTNDDRGGRKKRRWWKILDMWIDFNGETLEISLARGYLEMKINQSLGRTWDI